MNAQIEEIGYVTNDGSVLTEEQVRAIKHERLQALYASFAGMRDRWVQHRVATGVERRWRKSNDLFHGSQEIDARIDLETTLKDGPTNRGQPQVVRSKVVVNIVRPKVEQAVARMSEILFPVDDRNWGIRPTPQPELAARVGDSTPTIDSATGQRTGFTADQEAKALMQAAKEAAENMQRSIDDDLVECQYNAECRKLIDDGVRLGTGIIKGPYPRKTRKKAWVPSGNVHLLQTREKLSPSSKRCDPWDIFFDPACGNDHQRGRGVWERRPVTRKELRALIGVPGYDADGIRRVLMSKPTRLRVAEARVTREYLEDDAYELWEYHGEVEPQDLECLGERLAKHPDEAEDPLKGVSDAVLVMVNDVVVGCMESWIEDGTLPYDVWTWRQADDSPYGHSLPEELEHQQSVVTGAWRQLMDNGRTSSGGQIVMRRKAVIPANGRYEITPNKLWYAADDVIDVEKVFRVFEFNSHTQELLAVAQAALNFSDMESGLPQLMGGEKGPTAPDTVGGMIMLYNNANAVLRRRVKLYDDNVTRPHIGRYYDFKMANDPDGKIKGDFEVDARGSSTLVERDIQNQAMLNLANIVNNPRYAKHLKEREELKAILKAFKLDADKMMKTEEQVKEEEANTPPQQDPRIASAELNLQAKQMDIADRKEQRQFEAVRNELDDQFRTRQLAYNQQREQAEFEIAMTDSALDRDVTLLREQNKLQATREANAARERMNTLSIETKRQIFNAEAQLKAQAGSGI